MRTNLIMHFHCSECGAQLRIAESKEGVEPKRDSFLQIQEPKEPTGAACHYTPSVRIVPCWACIDKYTGPAKKLTEAIAAMQSEGMG